MAANGLNIAPARQKNWDWRAVGNFLCGGAGSGLIVAAAAAAPGRFDFRIAVAAGTLLVAIGLLLVWTELGRPARFLNVFRNPWTSWMSRESCFAVILVCAGVVAAWSGSAGALVAAAVSAALFLYSQARMLLAARGIAAWRTPRIVPLIVATGLTEGIGLLLLLWTLHPAARPAPVPVMAGIGIALLALRALAWTRYRSSLEARAPELTRRALRQCSMPFALFGTLLPVLPLFMMGLIGTSTPLVPAAAGLCMLLGGWALKFVIFTEAAYNQGFALAHSPARGAGSPGPGVRPGWSGAG